MVDKNVEISKLPIRNFEKQVENIDLNVNISRRQLNFVLSGTPQLV